MNAREDDALLEVIIPVKDRWEVKQCVRSLTTGVGKVARVIVSDGGSTDTQCLDSLKELEQLDNVRVMRFLSPGFNKSMLINKGIAHATADLLLISDADIVWNEAALDALLEKVLATRNTICYIQEVEESQPNTDALKRDRYTYNIRVNNDVAFIDIVPGSGAGELRRPGCGLICARRSTLITLGGYKEIFTGWGWEDQDLLIRASLFGIQICVDGRVMHLSHPDTARNRHHGNVEPILTRNRNIRASLQSLSEGVRRGNLPVKDAIATYPKEIHVQLPKSLSGDRS